jgi:hypothetical protein
MTQFTCKGVKQINNRISLNMTFTFTICISLRFSSAREFQMGNFQKYWSQIVGQDFIVLIFSRAEDFESWRKGPSKSGEKCSRWKVHMYDVIKNSWANARKYTIYVHCQKIYNLFVQALEIGKKLAFCKLFCPVSQRVFILQYQNA